MIAWLPCQILNCQKIYHGSHGADEERSIVSRAVGVGVSTFGG